MPTPIEAAALELYNFFSVFTAQPDMADHDKSVVTEILTRHFARPDDGEFLTEEWLRSVGFDPPDDKGIMEHDGELLSVTKWSGGFAGAVDKTFPITTRGDLRRLMDALKIQPKEVKGG